MPWHPVSTNRYERAFDSLKFDWGIAEAGAPLQKQLYLVSCSLKPQHLAPVKEARQAWKALRRQYPQIAAVADKSGTRLTYTVPSPEELEAWVHDIFLVVEESSATHLYQTLPPSSLFCLYKPPFFAFWPTARPSRSWMARKPPNFDPTTRGHVSGRYTGFNVIDHRKYLSTPYNGPDAAVAVYHTGIPFSVDLAANHDFASLAAAFARGYKRDLSRKESRNIFTFLAESSSTRPIIGCRRILELSSVGVVNDYLPAEYEDIARKLEVQGWLIAVECINRLLLTNVWTWDGQTQLAVNWNESFYEEEFVTIFLDSWMLTLTRELGVN
ncbi:hypothetical protein BDV36DRAFT_302592 [Aspergillus pseudocaelatus]|uniref:Uncharacterized protein n=1 Tax=Aspergillus pseudocaelatus TaxID=1825620 RepID=A0ABQ6W1Y8_9EURO|nr:hypothetical protein BDV36DRAFT_302592 [Aspergillus pseudocaelatus]